MYEHVSEGCAARPRDEEEDSVFRQSSAKPIYDFSGMGPFLRHWPPCLFLWFVYGSLTIISWWGPRHFTVP
jgi:hypothetical protein